MTDITGTILFIALISTALIIVSFVNRAQTHKRVVRLKVQQLRTRINELEDIIDAISPLLESTMIPQLINKEVLDLIQSITKLSPESNNLLELSLKNAQNQTKILSTGVNNNPTDRIQASDAAIAKQQYYLNEAGKVIRRHQTLGLIAETEMHAYIQELAWAHLMVAALTHIAQGHQAIKNRDPMVALGFYRNAQHLLSNSSTNDNRKPQFIKQLTEILNGQRQSIDSSLMPEDEFNPPTISRNAPQENNSHSDSSNHNSADS